MTTTIVLVGVGGQGTILAGDVLANCAVAEGFVVKLSEIHGMAQRGGSVQTIVRFGETVHSPVIDTGTVDVLVGFELIEAARALPLLKPDGYLVVNRCLMPSLPMLTGASELPLDVEAALLAEGALLVDANALACEAGSPRSANIVLLGAASARLSFGQDTWERIVESRVPPETAITNIKAFHLGQRACNGGTC